MTAERVPPRWRRRRGDETEDVLEPRPTEADGGSPSDAVPQPRPPLTSRSPAASGGSWAGRASAHRREQVRARGPGAAPEGPTGPVDSERAASTSSDVRDLWEPIAERLQDDTVSSVLLCTPAGKPLAAHGLPEADVARVCGLTGAIFGAGGGLTAVTTSANDPVETVSITAGQSHTVVAALPAEVGGHLVSVTAQGVSLGVLLVRTRQAADEMRAALSAAAE